MARRLQRVMRVLKVAALESFSQHLLLPPHMFTVSLHVPRHIKNRALHQGC